MAPYDSTTYLAPEVRETKPDLSKPSLEGLEWLLRQPMPDGLQFDYLRPFPKPSCGSIGCARGVARYVWGNDAADALGLSSEISDALFFGWCSRGGFEPADITPLMVANAIRHYRLTGEVRHTP